LSESDGLYFWDQSNGQLNAMLPAGITPGVLVRVRREQLPSPIGVATSIRGDSGAFRQSSAGDAQTVYVPGPLVDDYRWRLPAIYGSDATPYPRCGCESPRADPSLPYERFVPVDIDVSLEVLNCQRTACRSSQGHAAAPSDASRERRNPSQQRQNEARRAWQPSDSPEWLDNELLCFEDPTGPYTVHAGSDSENA
jgi:hypothetical protein